MATTTPALHEDRRGIWASLVDAIRGTQQDFTEGRISRAILILAVPMVLEMLMESLFSIVNIFWVTRLGSDAVATVGLTESLLTIVFSVAFGVAMSTTAMVARRVGEKDQPGAAVAATQSIILGVGLSVLLGIPSAIFAPDLLGWMGGSPSVVDSGKYYAMLTLGGCINVMLLFMNNAIFRGAGDASVAMRVLWFSNAINLVLDPCLIFGLGPFPELGITGAGFSTLIGRGSGVLYQFYILFSGKSRIKLTLKDFRVVPDVILSLMRVSATGVSQFLIAHSSWVALVRIISTFGSAALAGYTIGIRIFLFAILPSWGLSGAAATMVGQNLGAKKPERAERAVYITGLYNTIVLGLVAIVFVFFPRQLVNVFTTDPTVVPFAVECLRVIGFGNVIYAWGMVMVQAFNGAGDTVTPTWINIIGFWLCEIPLAWILAYPAGMGVSGVFYSIPIAETVITALGLWVFMRGRWKTRVI